MQGTLPLAEETRVPPLRYEGCKPGLRRAAERVRCPAAPPCHLYNCGLFARNCRNNSLASEADAGGVEAPLKIPRASSEANMVPRPTAATASAAAVTRKVCIGRILPPRGKT